MTVEVHLLSHDDEQMLEWSLRHYGTFADLIIVHDGGPKGISKTVADRHEKAVAIPWDAAGQLNDELAMRLKNSCWRGTEADWMVVADADELLWLPYDPLHILETYKATGAAVIRPRGFDMFSEEWFEPADHPGQQITRMIRTGAPEEKWYSKPVLFSPRLVAESGFGIGAHEAHPVLKDGRGLRIDKNWPHPDPECRLLHYKAIGPIERVAARYDATRARLAAINVRQGWGNVHDTGMEHALKKRALILRHLRDVLA